MKLDSIHCPVVQAAAPTRASKRKSTAATSRWRCSTARIDAPRAYGQRRWPGRQYQVRAGGGGDVGVGCNFESNSPRARTHLLTHSLTHSLSFAPTDADAAVAAENGAPVDSNGADITSEEEEDNEDFKHFCSTVHGGSLHVKVCIFFFFQKYIMRGDHRKGVV